MDPLGLEFKLPHTYKSPSGVSGAFSEKGYSYRIDTNRISDGEGGFHVHIYKDKSKTQKVELAKVMGKGSNGTYVETHKGRTLLKPTELPKTVRREIRRLVRNAKKFLSGCRKD